VATSLRFTRIEAGVAHTCGLTSGGAGWCWGRNTLGQLGDGTTVTRSTPVQVAIPAGLTSQELAPGEDFTCALASNGTTYCWGSNHRGQLGRGTHDQDPHPDLAPLSGNLTFTSIAVGLGSHACGLTSTGAAYCWGGNGAGELGDGSVATSFFPVAVSGGIAFEKLEIGGSIESGITCGLTSAADAYCWGYNRFGQVGAGSTARDIRTPVVVAGGRQYESVSVGMLHACGLTISGTLYCWGSGRVGQLGVNYTTTSAVPLKVAGQP
jgi:alpha-tubulin suppressor-like RCC1 family protein